MEIIRLSGETPETNLHAVFSSKIETVKTWKAKKERGAKSVGPFWGGP